MQAQEIHPGLWQGSWPAPGPWLKVNGFSTLVLCAQEFQPPHIIPPHLGAMRGLRMANPWPGVEVIYAPNDDDPYTPPPKETLRGAIRAGRIVAERLSQNRKVLVTCWQGRNRSGLVSALGLFFHLGIPGEQATEIVQRRRTGVFVDPLSRLQRDDHANEAVVAQPSSPQANLHRPSAIWTPQSRFTLPSGGL